MSHRQWDYQVSGDPIPNPAARSLWAATSAATPTSTPSRRTRQHAGLTNWTHYQAFERREGKDVERYVVGNAIVLAGDTPVTQRELRGRPPRNGYGQDDVRRKVKDSLPIDLLVGLIVDIYLDEKRELNMKVHWLIRPRHLVADWKEGEMEDLKIKFHEQELLYATDPAFHLERERALAAVDASDPFSIPSVSLAARHKTSKAQDTLPTIYIERHLRVGSKPGQEGIDFFVTRRWHPTARGDADAKQWAPSLDFAALHERGLSTGQWEHGDEQRAKAANLRQTASATTTPTKAKAKRQTYQEASSSESESSEDEEEEVFDPRSQRAGSQETDPTASDEEVASDPEESALQPSSAKRRRPAADRSEDGSDSDEDNASPRRSRKNPRISLARPQRRRERLAIRTELTLARRKQAEALNLPAGVDAAHAATLTPWQRARAALHVSNTPDVLPCREDQSTEIYSFLDDAIDERTGACLYISGVPGTGKTATVRSVVRDLQDFAASGKINSFRFLELNGMKLSEPLQAFAVLWEFISGQKATARHALSLLEAHFKQGAGADGETYVVLVDELDQLLTKKNEVIYNFFNWPSLPRSRLIVVAIANTMDLPERELSGKIVSRLGENRLVFSQYTWQQLTDILTSRLAGLDGVIEKKAIEWIAKAVAKVTGDARRALDVMRRTVERVESEIEAKPAEAGAPPRLIAFADVRTTLNAMDETSAGAFVKRCSLHQKVFLLALSRCARGSANDDTTLGEVMVKHLEFVRHRHLVPVPSQHDLLAIFQGLTAMRLVVVDAGHGGGVDSSRVKLDVRDKDLEHWLSEDPVLRDWVAF